MERLGRAGVAAATAASATAASAALFALGALVGNRRASRLAASRRQSDEAAARFMVAGKNDSVMAAERAADAALDCPICLSELVLPRVAGCGHSICTSCLEELAAHDARMCCPVCRKRIRRNVSQLPINFAASAVIEARVAARGPAALAALRAAEAEARAGTGRTPARRETEPVMRQLRPAWHWFKWTVIIVTEFGAFLVSLKEVLEARPSRTRRHQRIV